MFVLFDEMVLKKALEYNKKLHLGELDRRSVPVTQDLVLIIKGIFAMEIVDCILCLPEGHHCRISQLKISGFDPIGMTCDLSQRNRKNVQNT